MTFLEFETQVMAKRKAGSQIDNLTPDHKKIRNRLDLYACRWNAIHRWKALNMRYNFASDLIPIEGMSEKLWPRKVGGVQP
jgi:hypothetical protein